MYTVTIITKADNLGKVKEIVGSKLVKDVRVHSLGKITITVETDSKDKVTILQKEFSNVKVSL